MIEAEAEGMQCLAAERGDRGALTFGHGAKSLAATVPIGRVTHHRVTGARQVNPDLMRTAGLELALHQCERTARNHLADPVMGYRRSGLDADDEL